MGRGMDTKLVGCSTWARYWDEPVRQFTGLDPGLGTHQYSVSVWGLGCLYFRRMPYSVYPFVQNKLANAI